MCSVFNLVLSRIEVFKSLDFPKVFQQYSNLIHFDSITNPFHPTNQAMKHEATMTKVTSPRKTRITKQNQTEFITYAAFKALRQYMKKLKGESESMSYQKMNAKLQTIDHYSLASPNIVTGKDFSLQCLAIVSNGTIKSHKTKTKFKNALDLTLPATKVLLKDQSDDFFQLSGHLHSLSLAGPGTVRKRCNGGAENTEHIVYQALSKDNQINFVPKFYGFLQNDHDSYIEMENLLYNFESPCVMDVKIGTRTFTECEVSNRKARGDLYEKMIAVDPSAPTEAENNKKAITKLRYMQFREEHSSTCIYGFRIDGMKFPDSPPITDLKTVKDHQSVMEIFMCFFARKKSMAKIVVERLKDMRMRIEQSVYFQTHEVIGSSILIIYDERNVGVWLIDFAKTYPVPEGIRLTHRTPWQAGNHEEGLLFGLDNLISMIEKAGNCL